MNIEYDVFWSHCPVVKVEEAQLIQFVTVGTEQKPVPFTQKLSWIRKCGAVVMVRHKDAEIKENSHWEDCGGKLFSCVKAAIETAAATAKQWKVDSESTMRIEVDLVVFDTPTISLIADSWYNKPKFRHIPQSWKWAENKEDVKPNEILNQKAVWTSRLHASDEIPEQLAFLISDLQTATDKICDTVKI